MEIVKGIAYLVIFPKYRGRIICHGRCFDNAYVQNYLRDVFPEMLIYGPVPSNQYVWFGRILDEQGKIVDWGEIDASEIYSAFPKDQITLSENDEEERSEKSKIKSTRANFHKDIEYFKEEIRRICNISDPTTIIEEVRRLNDVIKSSERNNKNVKYLFDLFVADELKDPDIRSWDVFCDKVWLEGEKIFFRGLKVSKSAMQFLEKEKGMGENIYSLDFSNERYGTRPGIMIQLTYRRHIWDGSDLFNFLNE